VAAVDLEQSLPRETLEELSQWRARYLRLVADELYNVLFDNRRGTCHCLLLNYWIRCGGLQAFLAQFSVAYRYLWDLSLHLQHLQTAISGQGDGAPPSGKCPRAVGLLGDHVLDPSTK
jgi:hypothetical protein